jgi:hypothetical protein
MHIYIQETVTTVYCVEEGFEILDSCYTMYVYSIEYGTINLFYYDNMRCLSWLSYSCIYKDDYVYYILLSYCCFVEIPIFGIYLLNS